MLPKIFVGLFIFMPSALWAQIQVSFSENINVGKRDAYTWEHLAEFDGVPEHLQSELAKLPLPKTPDIRKIREQIQSITNAKVLVKIPMHWNLTTENNFSVEEFKRRFANEIKNQCAPCQIDFLKIRQEKIKFPQQWRFANLNYSTQRSQLVEIVDETNEQKFWLPVEVKMTGLRAVAAREIKFGEGFNQDTLKLQWVDLTQNKNAIADLQIFSDQKSNRQIHIGEVIQSSYLTAQEVVLRGQNVKLKLAEGPFEIEILAIAEESATLGKYFKLKIPQTGKIVNAKSTAVGEARME